MNLDALKTALRAELDEGPDAGNLLLGACPVCAGDVIFEQVLQWRFYPDGNGYLIDCADWACPFTQEVTL